MDRKSYSLCPAAGAKLRSERDAVDLISDAHFAEWTVIPMERLDEDFFRLRSGIAGAFLQKFVNYDRRVAVVGDISSYMAESSAFHDFVIETNRGRHIWFVENIQDLEDRLHQSPENSGSKT